MRFKLKTILTELQLKKLQVTPKNARSELTSRHETTYFCMCLGELKK